MSFALALLFSLLKLPLVAVTKIVACLNSRRGHRSSGAQGRLALKQAVKMKTTKANLESAWAALQQLEQRLKQLEVNLSLRS